MNQVWSFEDIAAFGKEVDGVLEIKDSFTIDKLHDGSMQCVIVSAMAAYKGEAAPKIYFELSDKDQDTSLCPYHLGWINLLPYDPNRPIYSSHLYRIGKREEYVFQSWRVPPMFFRTLKITMRVEIPEGTTLCIKTFGTEIEGYTWDKSAIDEELIRKFDALGIDKTKCRVGIEVQMGKYTPEIAKMITDAGYFAAAWAIKRRDFEEYERLIEMGVTEFTEDYHCSMGLNFQA